MMTWQEASQLPEYGALTDADKIKAKVSYFNASVEDMELPSELIPQARTEFFKFVKEKPDIDPESLTTKGIGLAERVGRGVVGAGEALLSTGSGMAGMGAGVLSAGVTAIPEWVGLFPKGTSKETLETVANFLTYKPMTEAGGKASAAVSYPIEEIYELADYLGDRELKVSGSPALATSINLAVKAIPSMLAKKQGLTKTIKGKLLKGKLLPDEMVTKEPVTTSPDISSQPAYKRAGIEPRGYVHDLEVVESPLPKQIKGMPERLALPEPQTKGLPPSPITYGDNFVSMSPDIAPKPQYPYAGQKRLPSATDFEVTPEGQGINIKAQEAISKIEPSQILFDNLTKPQAIYQQGKRFKETGIKPEIRQMADGAYYLYEVKPDFKLPVEKTVEGKPPQGEPLKPQGDVTSLEGKLPDPQAGGGKGIEIIEAIKKRGIKGDKLLDIEDMISEVEGKGLELNSDGTVNLYHRTTPDAASKIIKTGKMISKEDGLFFGTKPNGQIEGYGNAVIRVKLPIEKIELNDIFSDEAHFRLPTKTIGKEIYIGKAEAGKGKGEIPNLKEVEEINKKLSHIRWDVKARNDLDKFAKIYGEETIQDIFERKLQKKTSEEIFNELISKQQISHPPSAEGVEGLPEKASPLKPTVEQGKIDVDTPKPIYQFKEGSIVEVAGQEVEVIKHSLSGTTVRPIKSKMQQIEEKTISVRPKPYQISGQSEGKLKVDKSILKSEKGGASLDLLVPELPTRGDINSIGKGFARPTTQDRQDKYIKEFDEGIKNFGRKYIFDKWKSDLEKIKLIKEGKLSPKEEQEFYSDIMFLSGGLNSVLKPAMRVKFNPFKGLYKRIVNLMPHKLQEFLDPLSTLKDADSLLVKRAERGGKSTQIERIGITLEKWFDKYSPEEKAKMFDVMRGKLPETAISPEALKTIRQTRPVLSLVGKMAVKERLLPEEIYLKNKDTYIHYLYAKHILGEDVPIRVSGAGKLDLGEFKARMDKEVKQDLSAIIKKIEVGKNKGKFEIVSDGKKYEEIFTTEKEATNKLNTIKEKANNELKEIEQYRKSIGLIQDPSIAVPVGVSKTLTDIHKNKYYRFIADNPDWTWQPSKIKVNGKVFSPTELADEVKTAKAVSDYAKTPETLERYNTLNSALDDAITQTKNMPKNFRQIPDTPNWGELKGLAVKEEIYKDLMPLKDINTKDLGGLGKILNMERVGMAGFKIAKTGLNLPTYARNTTSNIVQLNMSGMNYADIARDTIGAITDIAKRNPDYIKAERMGLFKSNWAVSEIDELLESMKGVKGFDIFTKLEKLTKYYNKIDDVFKLAKFKNELAQGSSEEKALLEALKWGMDYSRASRSVKYVRKHAIPFLSYSYKVAPLIAESLIERPWVIGKYLLIAPMMEAYVKNLDGLSKDNWKKLEAELPSYIKNTGSYMVMPQKDDKGKYKWINLEYFFPWGNFKDMLNTANLGEVSKASTQMVNNPYLNILYAMKTNKDPFTNTEIYSKLDSPAEQASKKVAYILNQALPPMTALESLTDFGKSGAAGYTERYVKGEKDRYGRKVTGTQALGRWFGVNLIQPSAKQTQAIKTAQVSELLAAYKRKMTDPNTTPQEKKEYQKRFVKMRTAIFTGEQKETIPVSKIKENIQPTIDKTIRGFVNLGR